MAEIDLGSVIGPMGPDGITPHIDMETGNWFVGADDTGVKAEGRDGVSIASIVQTTESSEDGGTNIITITMSDGMVNTFRVRNGTGGSTSEGAAGKDGISISSIVQTTTSKEDGGNNVLTITLSDGTHSTFQVRNGMKGSTGAKGEPGADGANGRNGFSPVITENNSNGSDTYKLDIETQEGRFTTPNLKGSNGVDSTKTKEILDMLNGIRFGMDADGNWGYMIPGATDIISFGGGGSAFSVDEWYVTSGESFLVKTADNSWNVGHVNGYTSVSWAVKTSAAVSVSMMVYKPTSRNFQINLNGEEIYLKGYNDFASIYTIPLKLIAGVNNLQLTGAGTVSGMTASLPSVAS